MAHFRVASSLCFKANDFNDFLFSCKGRVFFEGESCWNSEMTPISTVSSGLTKKQCFYSWVAQDLSARLFCRLPDLLLTQSIFLNVFFPFLCHYVLSVEGSDEEKIIIIIIFY